MVLYLLFKWIQRTLSLLYIWYVYILEFTAHFKCHRYNLFVLFSCLLSVHQDLLLQVVMLQGRLGHILKDPWETLY